MIDIREKWPRLVGWAGPRSGPEAKVWSRWLAP